MTQIVEIFEQALDDFAQTVYFYVDGSTVRRDERNGMWRLSNAQNKNIDNDLYVRRLMQRNHLQLPD